MVRSVVSIILLAFTSICFNTFSCFSNFSAFSEFGIMSIAHAKKEEVKKSNKSNKVTKSTKSEKPTKSKENKNDKKTSKKEVKSKSNKIDKIDKSNKKSKNSKKDDIKETLNKVSHQKSKGKDEVQEYLSTLSKKQQSSFKKLGSKEKMRLIANFSAKNNKTSQNTSNKKSKNDNDEKPVTQKWINRPSSNQTQQSQPVQQPQQTYVRQGYTNTRGRSFGQLAGLHQTIDPLSLSAGSVMVEEEMTGQAIFSKNAAAILPIASITKLMTALVTLDARLPMTDILVIDNSDVDTLKGSSSRLRVGTRLTRAEALLLAMMSSENRAAHALARTHPSGIQAFVQLMNQKARQIGMVNTYFTDPTGLSSNNRSTASDLAKMVKTAYQQPVIRQFSTSTSYQLQTDYGLLSYRNTNPLVGSQNWAVNVSKTGYISEAGRCLVMHVQVLGRNFVFVLLDAIGKSSRVNDAIRIRNWIEQVLTTQNTNNQ